jgi:apolipoprotein N-acyltransferase
MARRKKTEKAFRETPQAAGPEPKLPPKWRDLLIATFSGVLLYLAFHPANLRYLMFIGFIPLLVLVSARPPKRAALAGFWFGFVWYGLSVSWVGHVHVFAAPLIGGILGLYTLLFGLIVSLLRKRCKKVLFLLVPAVWVVFELVRSSVGEFSFHWFIAGHPLAGWLPLIQIADITGIYGVSFLILMVNWVLLDMADAFLRGRKKPYIKAVYAAALFAIIIIYGIIRMQTIEIKDGPRILLVQGNIPQHVKETAGDKKKSEIFQDHLRLSEPVFSDNGIDMVIWPETMLSWSLTSEPWLMSFFSDFARKNNVAFLLGTWETVIENNSCKGYNVAQYFDQSGRMKGTYRKMFLVPVGEYIPLVGVLPLFPKLFGYLTPYGTSGFSCGRELTVFEWNSHKFAGLICFEISAPDLVRRARKLGCRFLVNLSNDAWFKDSAELDLAREQGIIRAVESRIGVVRVVNAGISSFIDPAGRAVDLTDSRGRRKEVEGYLIRSVSYTTSPSVYAAVGDVFALLCVLFSAACAFMAIRNRSRVPK